MKPRTIDANVILRFLLGDIPEQSANCRDLFVRLQAGEQYAELYSYDRDFDRVPDIKRIEP